MSDVRCERCKVDPDPRGWSACADCRALRSFDRPPREDYVRVTRTMHGYTVEPAIEYRAGDSFKYLAEELHIIVKDWSRYHGDEQMAVAKSIAKGIEHRWPDRAYFVEVWQDGREGFAQIFQPFGIPRNR